MNAAALIRPAALFLFASLLALGGCAPALVKAPLPTHAYVSGESPNTIRTLGPDREFEELPIESVVERARERQAGQAFNILALSGGGADGAFGAGALVGLTHSGTRPTFSVVTGVSAGALIAPYAFLGADWDRELTDAYTSGRAEHLLQSRGLGVILGSSAYMGSPLEQLVAHYLTEDLIQALAREAAAGRLLLIATTNVNTGEGVIWDLGSIALNGGPEAKALLRDVLVASASVPALFPPVVIHLREHGVLLDEAHVDGTATAPFLLPEALAERPRGGDGSARSAAAVYVIVDGQLSERPAAVELKLRPILSRSISVGLTHMMRTSLELTAASAELEGTHLAYSAIPVTYPNLAPFDFRASAMRALFQYGYDCAQGGRLWISSQHAAGADGDRDAQRADPSIQCPADDEFIARFAVR
jgi:predicted acylesterase/phospholipase RssA